MDDTEQAMTEEEAASEASSWNRILCNHQGSERAWEDAIKALRDESGVAYANSNDARANTFRHIASFLEEHPKLKEYRAEQRKAYSNFTKYDQIASEARNPEPGGETK